MARSSDLLFSERIRVLEESGLFKEFKVEVLRKTSCLELRLYDQLDIFHILISRIDENEYYQLKAVQGIRVDFFVFQRKVVEMLERVHRSELILSLVGRTAVILERNDFKNIVQIELPLVDMPEGEFRTYVSEMVNEMVASSSKSKREQVLLKEEMKRKEAVYAQRLSRLEAEIQETAAKYQDLLSKEKERESDLEQQMAKSETDRADAIKYKQLYEELATETAKNASRLSRVDSLEISWREKERSCKLLEEDLKKANEIIKRNFEEIKERKRAEAQISAYLDEARLEKEEIENRNTQLEVDLLEKKEEIKVLEEMERERKEVIDALKHLNRSLNKKLESAYRVYSRLHGRLPPTRPEEEETSKTEDSSGTSLVAPESIHY
ncbi:hypothetical protein NEHOM01_0067 [Nematocida homosporus]|uniref:uncharacterized protein n=1 Tax=Nematocida homosporus TaxID=1912981 RepID=UPI00221FC887|nr:uncharacterized protein NEHOM01_0067 [Nematocida homosporus]KAI5184322.1 hypothetical protein NEHOM01_0067 [Nematocida homosporus]